MVGDMAIGGIWEDTDIGGDVEGTGHRWGHRHEE